MKWFKHMTGMRNDMFIKSLRCEFGLDGYAIYCLILEIYGEECGNQPGKEVEFSIKVLAQEIGIKAKTLEKVITFCAEAKKFVVTFQGQKIKIAIPKMAHLRDDYSRKSGQYPDTNNKKLEDRDQKTDVSGDCLLSSSSVDGPPGDDDELKNFSKGFQESVKQAMLYTEEQIHSGSVDVRAINKFAKREFIHIKKKDPEIQAYQLYDAWRETIDKASKYNAGTLRWYEATFKEKLEARGVRPP